MTEVFQLSPASEEAHRAIAQKAAANLGSMVDGNGLKASSVRLVKQEIKVNFIPAAIKVTLQPEVARSQQRGQNPQGTALGSDSEAQPAAVAAAKEFLEDNTFQQEIMRLLKQVPGGGFGIEKPITFPTPAGKVFSVVSPCNQCKGSTVITCGICHGEGRMPCQTCRGEGFTQCRTCFGTGLMQDASGNRVSCTLCQHTGKIICHSCNGLRQLSCPTCAGRGSTTCLACGSSGFMTDIIKVSYKAVCEFDIDWRNVGADVRDEAAKLGKAQMIAEKGHAEIYWQPPVMSEKEGCLVVSCIAALPIANVEFSVEGKTYPAVVVGLQGRVVQMDPMLDPIVKPGIAALMKLSKGPLAAQALIDTACKYRLVRQVLAGLSRQSQKTVYQIIARDYPVALSDKYARATVRYAHVALDSISTGPRYKGLAAGTAVAGLLSAGYYMTQVRAAILAALEQRQMAQHIVLMDILVWLLGYAATVFVIKFMTAAAFKKMLPQTVQDGKKGGLPPAGPQGWMALPSTGIIWLVAAAFSAVRPEWLAHIFK